MNSTRAFPLTVPCLAIGLGAGVVLALLLDSLLPGYAVAVLVIAVGGTWERDRPVIVPFVLAYQWLAITVGYFYSLATGVFPSVYRPGDIERTLWLSLSGLLLLAVGFRFVCWLPLGRGRTPPEEEPSEIGHVRGLFWLVLAVYSIDYLYVVNARAFVTTGAIVARVLEFRQVLLLALWAEVLRRREHMQYLWLSLAWVFVPLLGSYYSEFKSPLILLIILFVSMWRPWESSAWVVKPVRLLTGVVAVFALAFVVLLWQAGVKKEARQIYDADTASRGPLERVALFVSSAEANLPVVLNEPQIVLEGLVERLSYITFFSRVLEYVPRVQPHTNGELLNVAFSNALLPRFLFPSKPELPSDSVYTRRFTGIYVPEEGTSISIGYMAEFYVDWGVTGMLVMVFCFGCWIGVAYRLIVAWVRPQFLVNAVLISVLMTVSQFEQQFIKAFGALNIATAVAIGLTVLFRKQVVEFLDVRPMAAEDGSIETEPSLT